MLLHYSNFFFFYIYIYIINHHYFTCFNLQEMILVEYEDSSSLRKALDNTHCSLSNGNIIPVQSPVMWLAAKKGPKSSTSAKLSSAESSIPFISEGPSDELALFRRLHHCKTVKYFKI